MGPKRTSERPFEFRPSVGTWLVARAPAEPEPVVAKATATPVSTSTTKAAFHHRPSVGSWLSKIPAKVQRPWFLEEIDVGEHQEYVRGLQQIISAKDAELERLKAQVEALMASQTPTAGSPTSRKRFFSEEPLSPFSRQVNNRPQTSDAEEALRSASKEALLNAAKDGSLWRIAQMQGKANQKELRDTALLALLKSASDGTLIQACQEISLT